MTPDIVSITARAEAARALADAATPGPRHAYNDNEGMDRAYGPLWCVANAENDDPVEHDPPLCFQCTVVTGGKEDAELCAASRTLVPALCADITALLAHVASLERDLARHKAAFQVAMRQRDGAIRAWTTPWNTENWDAAIAQALESEGT